MFNPNCVNSITRKRRSSSDILCKIKEILLRLLSLLRKFVYFRKSLEMVNIKPWWRNIFIWSIFFFFHFFFFFFFIFFFTDKGFLVIVKTVKTTQMLNIEKMGYTKSEQSVKNKRMAIKNPD